MAWRAVDVVSKGSPVRVRGRDVWGMTWRDTGERVPLPHPSHPTELHLFSVFKAGPWWASVRFAAAELSADLWGFYVRR